MSTISIEKKYYAITVVLAFWIYLGTFKWCHCRAYLQTANKPATSHQRSQTTTLYISLQSIYFDCTKPCDPQCLPRGILESSTTLVHAPYQIRHSDWETTRIKQQEQKQNIISFHFTPCYHFCLCSKDPVHSHLSTVLSAIEESTN